MELTDSMAFQWVLIPALIFISRILDVTIGTIRIIFLSKGLKKLAPFFGFFEVLIWLIAIKQLMDYASNVAVYIAYAGGFATGTFVGMLVEERISIGQVIIRIITRLDGTDLAAHLRSKGYRITELQVCGEADEVRVIFTVIKRDNLATVEKLINEFNPHAFYSVEDVRFVKEGPFAKPVHVKNTLFRRGRKGK